MGDVTYSKSAEPTIEAPVVPTKPGEKIVETVSGDIEPPFIEYEDIKHKPYVVDYFDIGAFWNKDKTYSGEVGIITEYLKEKAESGKIANSTDAVKEIIKRWEKVAGVDKTERLSIRIGKIAAYVQFLKATDHLL